MNLPTLTQHIVGDIKTHQNADSLGQGRAGHKMLGIQILRINWCQSVNWFYRLFAPFAVAGLSLSLIFFHLSPRLLCGRLSGHGFGSSVPAWVRVLRRQPPASCLSVWNLLQRLGSGGIFIEPAINALLRLILLACVPASIESPRKIPEHCLPDFDPIMWDALQRLLSGLMALNDLLKCAKSTHADPPSKAVIGYGSQKYARTRIARP